MPILRLSPASKDYLWGGTRLVGDFGKTAAGAVLAESWELSCHPDGMSFITGGQWDGLSLPAYIEQQGRGVLGENCGRFSDFPILVKLIDAAQPLSVQVHPTDGYALLHEGQNGKTEVWHILDCGPGAYLYYGVNREVSREEFLQRLEDGTVTELLRKVTVEKGETYFIEAGTLHAIGGDIVLAEIQQNSNVTYRAYDYNRRDSAGIPRPLHLAQAAEVSRLTPSPLEYSFGGHLALCEYFCVDRVELDGVLPLTAGGDSFVSLLVIEGGGEAVQGEQREPFRKGDSLFIPADSGPFTLRGGGALLKTTIPGL